MKFSNQLEATRQLIANCETAIQKYNPTFRRLCQLRKEIRIQTDAINILENKKTNFQSPSETKNNILNLNLIFA